MSVATPAHNWFCLDRRAAMHVHKTREGARGLGVGVRG